MKCKTTLISHTNLSLVYFNRSGQKKWPRQHVTHKLHGGTVAKPDSVYYPGSTPLGMLSNFNCHTSVLVAEFNEQN